MITREESNRRLNVLADFLDKLPPERFEYRRWVGPDWNGKPDLSCGTTACALGWATVIPEFAALGLQLHRLPYAGGTVVLEEKGQVPESWPHTYNAAVIVFGIEEEEAYDLFTPYECEGEEDCEHPHNEDGDCIRELAENDATPQYVAKKIRDFIESRSP